MLKSTVKSRGQPDYILIGVVAILVVLGIVILASVSASFSYQKFGDTYYFLKHQILFGLILGLILAYLAYRINLSLLKKWAPVLLLINLVLMVMVFLPVIGSSEAKAARWIDLGPFSFQPSELLKLTFILYLASLLVGKTSGPLFEKKGQNLPGGIRLRRSASPGDQKIQGVARPGAGKPWPGDGFSQTLIAFLIVIGLISLLLYFQSDISTLVVIALVAAIMYFLINTPLWHSILIILIGAGGLFSLIKLAPYRLNRLLVFFDPDLDPMGIGYQIKQALIAVGAGGIGGVGLGMSSQKFGFLPQTISDSIFAVFSEETGFIGSLILVSLFLIFLWRGFKIAKASQNKFSQLAALGITSWIIIQSFVNIGAMIGILPLTGIPLPFVSYGGSALIVELIGVGILLNISKHS